MISDEVIDKIKNTSEKIVIYPYVKSKDGYIYEQSELINIPKIFKNSHEITELVFNDTYMTIVDELLPSYSRRERNLIYSNPNLLVELVTEKKVDDKCFPILKKYHSDKKYVEYFYNFNENIVCYYKEDKTFRIELFNCNKIDIKKQIGVLNKFLTSNII